MENNKESFKISFRREEIHFSVYAFCFPDDNQIVAYIPSLNLTGYGDTEAEAWDSLTNVVLPDFLLELIKLPESKVMAELRQYGWQRQPYLHKQLQNLQPVNADRVIRDFNLPAETIIHQQLVTV